MGTFGKWVGKRAVAISIPALAVVLLIVLLAWGGPSHSGEQTTQQVWTCSMHPQVRLPQLGKCPICGMNLIPASQLAAEQKLTEQRAHVETEKIGFRQLFREVRTVGKLDFNERRIKHITARIAGRVDRVHADFTGIEVKKNDHLLDIYSPELFAAQNEFLSALKASESPNYDRRFGQMNLDSARTKLQLLGILPKQIQELENNRQANTQVTIFAPIAGTIVEKTIREGQYVQVGDSLYQIAELDPIWLYLDIYEYDLGWVRYGQHVDVTVEAYPGEVFQGTVVFIDPFLNDQSRTVKVRVNLKNADRRLKPAMYASATVRVQLRSDGAPEPTGIEGKYFCPMHPEVVRDEAGICSICEMDLDRVPASPEMRQPHAEHIEHLADAPRDKVLAIRASAVLDTGRRKISFRKSKVGAYELVELSLGPRAESKDEHGQVVSYFPVLRGIHPGDEVVIRGGFLLDSQRQIEGMPSLLYAEGQSAANLHSGHTSTAPTSSPSANEIPGHKH